MPFAPSTGNFSRRKRPLRETPIVLHFYEKTGVCHFLWYTPVFGAPGERTFDRVKVPKSHGSGKTYANHAGCTIFLCRPPSTGIHQQIAIQP